MVHPRAGGLHPADARVEGRHRQGAHRHGQDLCLRHPHHRAHRARQRGDRGRHLSADARARHADHGGAARPLRLSSGRAHRVPVRRRAHRQADRRAQKAPADRRGDAGPPERPHEAPHRQARQRQDRRARRGRPHARHGLYPRCDAHSGQAGFPPQPRHVFRDDLARGHGHQLDVPARPRGDHRAGQGGE